MTGRRPLSHSRGERGNSLVAAILLSTACAAISASVVGPALARHGDAQQSQQRGDALAVAQSGIDWGLASVRGSGGRIDVDFEESLTIVGTGTVTIEYVRGDHNAVDDDGDGTVDEAEEARFTQISATGAVGSTRRGARVVVMGPTAAGDPESAIMLNVATPVAAIRGNAFVIDGRDHDTDGAVIADSPFVPALGTGGPAAGLIAQLPAMLHDQIIGAGGSPSVQQQPMQDMDQLIAHATAAGFQALTPGTYAGQQLGLDAPAGATPTTVCNGDLHLVGTSGGAGTLIVEGDLHISGDFTWLGTILVRGTLKFTGGGKSTRLLGAVVVGDSIEGSALTSGDIGSMTADQIGEIDAEQQVAYQAMVDNETAYVWDPVGGQYVQVKWDCHDASHTHNPGNLQPTQLTDRIYVEEQVWVAVADADDGGYYRTQGHYVTVVRQGVDPVLELAGNVEILFSRELAAAGASTADPEMSVLAWTEFGVAP